MNHQNQVRVEGTVREIKEEKRIGFIMHQGQSIFFHRDEVTYPEYETLTPGTEMTFVIGPDPRKPDKIRAFDLRASREEGVVDGLKTQFGFINTDSGERVFFHGSFMAEGCTFGDLEEGMRVKFKMVQSRKAKRGDKGSAFEAVEVAGAGQ